MFTAENVKVGGVSKWQLPGIAEKVSITEFNIITNEQWNTKYLEFKTINEQAQEGKSKRLSLNTTVNEGKSMSAWDVSAKYLLNIIMSATGKSLDEARAVLVAKSPEELVKNLENALIGKQFRGLFSSREYMTDKFAFELYTTEPVGGTKLVWDPNSTFYVKRLPTSEATSVKQDGVIPKNDLPF
jgi:hypothetical protein